MAYTKLALSAASATLIANATYQVLQDNGITIPDSIKDQLPSLIMQGFILLCTALGALFHHRVTKQLVAANDALANSQPVKTTIGAKL